MINIPRWQAIAILFLCVIAFGYAAPNLIAMKNPAMLEKIPQWLPHKTVSLGLDLQGGSHLLLQVDVDVAIKQRAEGLAEGVRPELRKEKIVYTRISNLPSGVRVQLGENADPEAVRRILRRIDSQLEITTAADGRSIDAVYGEAALRQIKDQTIGQSIEIVRRRVDETGTREPVIQRQGDDRIIVQLPGLDDPQRIKDLLGKTANLGFHLVDTGGLAAGSTRILPMEENPGQTLSVQRKPMLTGDMLVDAQSAMGQDGLPVVSFRLNSIGAKRFCDVTRENVNKPFAIVLDGKIVSAPNIREPICSGNAQISGNFTLQETSDTALLLRAGALPAPLHVMEERTVGPSLGADSIAAGKKACLMALLFVGLMASSAYGLFGVFATAGLIINMIMLIAVLSMLQATLTLPGIAGIVLTIGLAVDANVLIFERMKEELRDGRSILSAFDAGYTRAKTTITDSNLTSLIAAMILFSFGTGPIKGFAVTMSIGVITSYFCALMLTRLMILTWMRWAKPKTINV